VYLNSRQKPKTANWRLRNWLMLAVIYAITGLLWLRRDYPLAFIDPAPTPATAAAAIEEEPVENDAGLDHMARGDLYFDQGNLTAAREAYEEAVATNPDLATAYARWGRLLVLRLKYDEAVIRTQRAVELAPDDAEALAAHSMALDYTGDAAGAVRYAQEAIAANPNNGAGHAALAEAYMSQQKFQEALATAEQAVQIDPDSVWAWRSLGWIRENLGLWQEAIEAYREGIAVTPLSYLYVRLGMNERVLGNTEAATAALLESTVVDPRNPFGYAQLGLTYINMDDYASASDYLQQGITQDPTYAYSYALLGLIYYRQRNFEGAIEQLEKAVSFGQTTSDVYYELGLAHAYLEQCEQAIPWLERALALEPDSPPALEGMRICGATPAESAEAAPETVPEPAPAP
jgi:tetratricopeptide (TPR) repeat protein